MTWRKEKIIMKRNKRILPPALGEKGLKNRIGYALIVCLDVCLDRWVINEFGT
jgi:hypothetical protein